MTGGGFFAVAGVNVWFGNPIIAGFTLAFGFMCFLFGFMENRKTIQP